jgi:haloacid dehalogenase superfamily, subfamily IA, variant 1 with third motif having Dx(3-4)D or Dx(3-4)E
MYIIKIRSVGIARRIELNAIVFLNMAEKMEDFMINTFLFDLDGTLLPMDGDEFEKQYFKRLSYKLIDYFKPEDLIKYIWMSTLKMVKNTGGQKTNMEVFFEDFEKITGQDTNVLSPIFDDFYAREFKELEQFIEENPYIIKTIDTLIDKGYEVVVATNPIFPMEAIKERIRWTGLKFDAFKYITSYENMHYCKPNTEYYSEILSLLGKKPEDCLMVGNDVEEDLIASRVGIKTFLVENHIINKKNLNPDIADYRGSYKDLYEFVDSNIDSLK